VLGVDHPVARAARARSILAGQFAVTSAVLATLIAYAFAHGAAAVTLLCSALVVELWAICGLAFTRGRLRERVRDVIADVDRPPPAAEIAAESAHLASPQRREQLARSLERALYAAEHWPALSITSRPPPTVRHLLQCRDRARGHAARTRLGNPGPRRRSAGSPDLWRLQLGALRGLPRAPGA
jgi:hypothetical protein